MSFTLSFSTLVQNKMTNSAIYSGWSMSTRGLFKHLELNVLEFTSITESIQDKKNAFYFFGVKSFLPEVIPDKEMCSYILFI